MESQKKQKSRGVAVVLAVFLGGFGVHRFYLGHTVHGLIYLALCWTGVPYLLAWCEAIWWFMISRKSFCERYEISHEDKAPSEPKLLRSFRESQAWDGEVVLDSVLGYSGDMMGSGDDRQCNGLLVLTDRRVVFTGKRLMSEVFEQMPLSKVASVESRSNAMGLFTIKVHGSNNAIEFKTFMRDARDRIMKAIEERSSTAANVAPSADRARPVAPSAIEQIERLSALRDSGALTDEEFQAKKADLLRRM